MLYVKAAEKYLLALISIVIGYGRPDTDHTPTGHAPTLSWRLFVAAEDPMRMPAPFKGAVTPRC